MTLTGAPRTAGRPGRLAERFPGPGADDVRPGLVLAICCAGLLMVTVDGSIVHVALPSIRADLGGGPTALAWVVDGYLLVLASLLVLAGATADRLCRRRVFVIGLVLFSLSSLLCGLAPSVPVLVAARVLQGVGAAMLNPVALALIVHVYPDVRRRARAIGAWSAVSGLGTALGPPLGGLVVELGGWRGIFLVNVPVAIVAVVLTLRFVPHSRAATARRADPLGQLLLTGLVASGIFALIEGPHRGLTPVVAVALVVLVSSALGFVWHGLRHPEPLVDPRLFRSRSLVVAVGCAVAGFACFGGALYSLSLTLQTGAGYSALAAGLLVLPIGVAALATSPWIGPLVGRGLAHRALLGAGVLLAIALVGLALVVGDGGAGGGAGVAVPALLALGAVFGIGFGMLNPPVTATAISGLPPDRAGVAGALASTSRQLGLALGVALAAGLVSAHASGSVAGWAVWAGLVPGALVVLALGWLLRGVARRRIATPRP